MHIIKELNNYSDIIIVHDTLDIYDPLAATQPTCQTHFATSSSILYCLWVFYVLEYPFFCYTQIQRRRVRAAHQEAQRSFHQKVTSFKKIYFVKEKKNPSQLIC